MKISGKEVIPTEHMLKVIKLIKDSTSVYEDALTIHAEGSLAAQKLSIYALADFNRYKVAANRSARIQDETEHPIFSQLLDFPPELA